MRIQKIIAQSGVASRREAEQLIIDGRVKVNGQLIYRPGHPIDVKNDVVTIDDKALPPQQSLVYYALNKPRGYLTTRNDPQGRKSVFELLTDLPFRLEAMGRLDFNSTGLVLFTNDGELSHQLSQTKFEIPTRYSVKVWKKPSERQLNRIRHGIRLEDGITKKLKLRILESTDSENTWFEVTVTEHKNRLIRRLFEAIGHPVSKLRRESFATIALGKLPLRAYRPLNGDEIQRLRDIAAGTPAHKAGKTKSYGKGFAKPKKNKPKPGYKRSKNRGPQTKKRR